MNRRAFTTGLCLGITSIAGCLGEYTTNDDPNGGTSMQQETTRPEETTVAAVSSGDFSARLSLLEADVQVEDEIVSSQVDCETATISIVGGYSPPDDCYDLEIDSLDEGDAGVEVALTTTPNESRLDAGDCGITTYKYRLVVEADSRVPDDVTLRYRYHDDRQDESFSVEIDSC